METSDSSRPVVDGSNNGPSSHHAITSDHQAETPSQHNFDGEQQSHFVTLEQFNNIVTQLQGVTSMLETSTQKAPSKITNLSLNEKEDKGLPKEKLVDDGSKEEHDDHNITRKEKEHPIREEMPSFTGIIHRDHEEELRCMRKRLNSLELGRKRPKSDVHE